ncbi:hypothetical protein WH06_04180, partial [Aeromonas salmonicida subsp. salmonicida]
PASNGDGKMIQVLASGSKERAEAMGKVMTQRYGVPYQVVTHNALFRVLLGPVAANQQATLLAQIRQGGWSKPLSSPEPCGSYEGGHRHLDGYHVVSRRDTHY